MTKSPVPHPNQTSIEPNLRHNRLFGQPSLDRVLAADKPNKLFFPTLEDAKSIWVWFGLVAFFSFYDVFSQFQYLPHWTQAFTLLFKTFVSNFCIIFGIVGYLQYSIASFQNLPLKAQMVHIMLVNLLMTPIMTLVAKIIIFILLQDLTAFQSLGVDILINTFLAILVTALLVYYFATQYRSITLTQHRYQKKLVEQNAQLKARITPHFFFNMLNTVQSLVETDAIAAADVLQKVSKLYRFSFYEPKEIALTEEIDLCEDYLLIEKHRFQERLQVTWELPDEDMLYDMVITSLTLQMLIEKMITTVVELTSQVIVIHIAIAWEQGWVSISLSANLPIALTALPEIDQTDTTQQDMPSFKNLSFQTEQDNLQRFFGDTASIDRRVEHNAHSTPRVTIDIRYALLDIA